MHTHVSHRRQGLYYNQSYNCTKKKKIDTLIFSTVVIFRSMGEWILTGAEMTQKEMDESKVHTNICESFNLTFPCTSYRQLPKSLHSPTSQSPTQAFLTLPDTARCSS